MSSGGLTELEHAIKSMENTFQQYAAKTGNSKTLSKKEVKILMETELPSFTKKDPAIIDGAMENLDLKNDGQVDFSKFLKLLSKVLLNSRD